MEARVGPALTRVLDVALDDGVRAPRDARVGLRTAAAVTTAEVVWLGGRFHQLRCAEAVTVATGDRLTLDGVGGATVLDPEAAPHGPSREVTARLTRLWTAAGPGDEDAP